MSGTTYTLGITLTGIANGTETITVTPAANSIYDINGNAASTTQSNNTATLLDGRIAIITSFEHDGSYGTYNSLIQIDSDTYLLAYKANGGNLKTFTIPADGSAVTQVASHNYSNSVASYMYNNYLLQLASENYIPVSYTHLTLTTILLV